MLDESLLDTPEALAGADRLGLLRGAAESGARVRTAARTPSKPASPNSPPTGGRAPCSSPGPARPRPASPTSSAPRRRQLPRHPPPPTGVAPLPARCAGHCPAGPAPWTCCCIATPDGAEPGLALLAEQAYRRGCTVVAVAPAGSPLADAVDGAAGLAVPMATAPYEQDERGAAAAPGALWALLTPLLALLDRVGLLTAPPEDPRKRRRPPRPHRRTLRPRHRRRTATPPRRSPPNSPTPSR